MTSLSDPRLSTLDGFRIEINEATSRGDIILARAPMNVISMPQRDQLRAAFEVLDADPRVRVIVLRGEGENFSSGGYIKGFLDASPEHVSHLADNIAAPARCSKPVIAARCLIPWFDGAILSWEWKDALWDKFVTEAPRPRTPSELQYNDRTLRSRR